MDNPVIALSVAPTFGTGCSFSWTLTPGFTAAAPWSFQVEESRVPDPEAWTPTSPLISGSFAWQELKRRRLAKDESLYFRVRVITPDGVFASAPVSAFGVLGRDKFNLAREIMRREELYARVATGVKGSAYVKNTCGAPCSTCLDPVSGVSIYGSDCPMCGGTKLNPPYIGPFPVWLTFSTASRGSGSASDGVGRVNPSSFTVRIAGAVQLKTDDILIDAGAGKRYHVDKVDVLAEICRLPVVQSAQADELPLNDPIYVLKAIK